MARAGKTPDIPVTTRRTAPAYLAHTLQMLDSLTGPRDSRVLDVRTLAVVHGELVNGSIPHRVKTEFTLILMAALQETERVPGYRLERIEDASRLKVRATRITATAS